jgi:hypothetical protein
MVKGQSGCGKTVTFPTAVSKSQTVTQFQRVIRNSGIRTAESAADCCAENNY